MLAQNPKTSGFNQRMKEARIAAGLTLNETAYRLRQYLPESLWRDSSTVHRLETKVSEDQANPLLVAALAKVYGVSLSKLSEPIANDATELVIILTDDRVYRGPDRRKKPPDQPESQSICTYASVA